jgi:hypothetical protein
VTALLSRFVHPTLSRFAAACMTAALLVGCGDGDVQFGQDTDYDTEVPQLAEHYATVLTSTVVQTHRETGEESTHVTRIAALAAIDQRGDRFAMQLSVCNIELPSVQDTAAVIDEEFLQSRNKVAPIDVEGGVFIDDDGVHLVTTISSMLLGVSGLDNSGHVPSDSDHENVIDQDGDGEVGISVAVGPGRVFVGLAANFELNGQIEAEDNRIEGGAFIELDKQIYGDTIWFYDVRELAEEEERMHSFESSASFQMSPVPPQTACDSL